MADLLQIKNLSKHYSETVAVDNISFNVPEGCCFGLLGPNGAGKTTTIEMMEGILKPTSGEILFEGKPLDKNYYQGVGIQFQHTAIQDFLTVKETLKLFANFYHKSLPIDELIELCALEEIISRDTRKLSGGQRQRLLLALAMLNDPKIIFLDEPTTGLDPQSRRNFWQLINNIKSQKKTILLTTHYMDEAESLCDEIVIVDQGHIIHQGTPTQMLKEHFDGVIISLPGEIKGALTNNQIDFETKNHRVEILSENIDSSIKFLLEHDISLDGLQVRSPNLEDLFIKLTGHQLRG
ncbi:ABC transporter ATP-binding protein [Aliikangiella coralliicola]|uniref:ABC transporter ATP-binding protein n=1 Tax=Aliikangiella coralliicola TaxID=2592383 RepID=A0A545TW83_9GAMM|nr:ABC transporter ATP-binding protein [Aliikangiella coralliicola]TQV81480.1 ABC transporter ATP-binding protein [Aliikangiella coralliicola]